MYIRVKRQKQTIFLQVQPSDTVLEVKSKLQELCDQVGTYGLMQLWKVYEYERQG